MATALFITSGGVPRIALLIASVSNPDLGSEMLYTLLARAS
jgi:hypothetical protein